MKYHPDTDRPTKRLSLSDTQQLVADIVNRVDGDTRSRQTWINRQAEYIDRRYCRSFRNTNWPWPDASDIVMPTIDMTIDRMKSTLSRVVFSDPMATFRARNPADAPRVQSCSEFFDWLLNEKMEGFREQLLIGLDAQLQHGFAIFKVFWDYRTRRQTQVLKRNQLPREYQKLAPGHSDATSNELYRTKGRNTISTQEQAQAIEADRENVEQRIANEWGLDIEDRDDKEALAKIVNFFKGSDDSVTFKTRTLLANNPRVLAVDPQDIIVPKTTKGIQDAQRITHRVYLTESDFKDRARDGKWSRKAVDAILAGRNEYRDRGQRDLTRETWTQNRDHREGIDQLENDSLIEVWEHYFRYDVDGDGQDETAVVTIQPGSKLMLTNIRELPFSHGEYPFIQSKFELNDDRYYSSRGVPEKIDDIDLEITKRHRNKLNNMDMMVPTFTYRFGSQLNPKNFSYQPGEMYPVVNHDDLMPMQIPDRTRTDTNEENDLLMWNENYLGGAQQQMAAQGNIHEARTATEIQSINKSASLTLSYRAEILQIAMKALYQQVWALWNQYGPEEVYIHVVGKPMKHMTKKEIRGKYDIIPVGTVATVSPEMEAQKALKRLMILIDLKAKLGPMGGMGMRYEMNLGEAVMDWLRKEDNLVANLLVRERTPEEIQQLQQQMQQQRAEQERIKTMSDALEAGIEMTPEEIKEMLPEIKKNAPHGGRTPMKLSPRQQQGLSGNGR